MGRTLTPPERTGLPMGAQAGRGCARAGRGCGRRLRAVPRVSRARSAGLVSVSGAVSPGGDAGPRSAMGKRLCGPGRGSGARGEGESCGAGLLVPSRRSVRLCGADGAGAGSGTRARGASRDPGVHTPAQRRRARLGVRARSSKKGKTKSFGGQGLPGRLFRNSFRRLLPEIYQAL